MSAGQRYSRLCVVPRVEAEIDAEYEPGVTGGHPMWWDDPDIEAVSGGRFARADLEQFFPGYLGNNPGVDQFYICRFFGTGSGAWTQLNEMATTWECLVLAEHAKDIGDVMTTFFPDDPRSASEWESVFQVSY